MIRVVAVAMLVLSLGLHWAFLQTIAWTGMLITYSRDGSFKEAFAKTFDGQHPCALCNAVQQGQEDENKQDKQQSRPASKLDFATLWQAAPFYFVSAHDRVPPTESVATSRADEPPKPHPRGSLDNLACA